MTLFKWNPSPVNSGFRRSSRNQLRLSSQYADMQTAGRLGSSPQTLCELRMIDEPLEGSSAIQRLGLPYTAHAVLKKEAGWAIS